MSRSMPSLGLVPPPLVAAALLALVCATLPRPAQAQSSPPDRAPLSAPWSSPRHQDHPLAGTIWDAAAGRPVGPAEFIAALAPHRVVLLGEIHDNADHHRLQAWIVGALDTAREAMRKADRKPHTSVVFEQIRTDQQPTLDAFYAALGEAGRTPDADDLLARLDWARSGWPDAVLYRPLFAAVLAAGMPIRPGNVARTAIRDVARNGLASLDDGVKERLGLIRDLSPPMAEALAAELRDSHCGLLPDVAIPGLAAAQRYRDAHLADALLEAIDTEGFAILIAGNGHVRSDRGVPWYLRERRRDLTSATVALVEGDPDRIEPTAYATRAPDGGASVDYVIVTPAAQREDPCEVMRRHMRSKR